MTVPEGVAFLDHLPTVLDPGYRPRPTLARVSGNGYLGRMPPAVIVGQAESLVPDRSAPHIRDGILCVDRVAQRICDM